VTDNANIAIGFALLADLLAGVPTLIKCYTHPQSESWVAYAISTAGFTLGILTIQEFNFQNAAFVTYLFLINGLMAILAVRKSPPSLVHIKD
jgi:hypothetical protein